ncbi:tyrosine-type recombinase/integrase [Pseudalkalibacillus sp. Hm43]|uniref:tyrosine-type recombinase/integrase n=1 Tax=Pseudalkalibacillus sp. Hm43 TaxID=3450742 RepID=UPI003F43AF70
MGKKKKMRSKMTNLEIAKDNVAAAFREARKSRLTVKKENWRSETYDTYEKTMITMVTELEKIIGKTAKKLLPKYMDQRTWDRYFEKMAERHDQGTITAASIQKRVHALEAFRTFVGNTNVCGKDTEINIGDKEDRLDYLKNRGVVRTKEEITAMKPTKKDTKNVHDNINTKTENGKIARVINELQTECGARIKSVFKLEVRDIDFENRTITFRNDKNNFTRTVPMTEEARKILEERCRGKKDGALVFVMQSEDGKDMGIKDAVKTVQRYTNDAAKKAGVNREKRRFTTHSNRKHYAQNLYDTTRNLSKNQIEKMIGNYIKMQGTNREQLTEKLKNELDRINRYRIIKKVKKRDFSKEQLRRLFVSLHLGHSRIDIVKHYVNVDMRENRKL